MYAIRLAKPTEHFFCNQTKLHLTSARQAAEVHELSEDMKTALRFGILVDIKGNVPREAYLTKAQLKKLQEELAQRNVVVEEVPVVSVDKIVMEVSVDKVEPPAEEKPTTKKKKK